ncbi:hypothetical protein PR202_ga28965 [Eleusine coracana subsp. coracana]|uniref:ARM repeat superfamily protein n=1 Tax=Eleusine coracana subsp. coracana TaxID=191504 RepID=A0AAV5DK53_ELECO|nr:hypothetical protein PR202_ga28965 [Eleusine coracana subsp. coracana]
MIRLVPHNYYGNHADNSSKKNLAPSLNIFYGMVLGQGVLYVAGCLLENFSFIPQRSVARHSGLKSHCGVEFVSLYYSYALEKSMEGDVLAPKKINLNSFAIYCLNSDKPKMQLHGIRVMHSLLLRGETRKPLFPKLTNSTKTMARLIEMLDWSSPEDTNIRLFASKVTAELATSLRVITLPGAVQVVSSLLDCGNHLKTANPLLLDTTDVEHEKIHDPIQNIDANHEERLDADQDIGNLLLETEEHSTQQVTTTEQLKSWKVRCWQCIFGSGSIPHEEPKPLTEQDLLPAIGMSILDGLVGCDQDNCAEISRASGLIPKIISFISYGRGSDTMYTDSQHGPSSIESGRWVRKVAGQALAMLAIDNVKNCLAMVLERIMDEEGAELEIFIGLGSQICQIIPGDFDRELEHGQTKERFVKRLVDALNANMEPNADCPGLRRVILQQAISLMEYDSRYAKCFKERRMKEALSMVEETASGIENHNLFLGNTELIETSEPLPRLVAWAKELLSVH